MVQERSTDADCQVITAELARRILALVGDDPYSVVGSRARTVLTTLGFTPSLPDTDDAEAEFVGEGYGYTGTVLSSAGDVNSDGFDDLLIGALGNTAGGPGARVSPPMPHNYAT